MYDWIQWAAWYCLYVIPFPHLFFHSADELAQFHQPSPNSWHGCSKLSIQRKERSLPFIFFRESYKTARQDSDWPICRTWPSLFQFSWFRWWGFILLGHLSKLDYVSRILWWATVGKHCDYRREKSLPKMWDVITKRICDDKTKWQCSPNSTWLYLFDTAGLH